MYHIIPKNNIWNNEATLREVRKEYSSRDEAIKAAKEFSNRYKNDFIIMKSDCVINYNVPSITEF